MSQEREWMLTEKLMSFSVIMMSQVARNVVVEQLMLRGRALASYEFTILEHHPTYLDYMGRDFTIYEYSELDETLKDLVVKIKDAFSCKDESLCATKWDNILKIWVKLFNLFDKYEIVSRQMDVRPLVQTA